MVKKTTIAIAVLVVVAVLGWGFWLGSSAEIDLLKEEIDLLKEERDLLDEAFNAEYDKLKGMYSHLYSLYWTLVESKVIAESAEWISEDERLKVTSELIPEYIWGEVDSYTVRVNVTNVGDEPLDIVWIFLFPYKDSKFASHWITGEYQSHSVKALYIEETYSYEFEYMSKEMTTYKIIVVAG